MRENKSGSGLTYVSYTDEYQALSDVDYILAAELRKKYRQTAKNYDDAQRAFAAALRDIEYAKVNMAQAVEHRSAFRDAAERLGLDPEMLTDDILHTSAYENFENGLVPE